MKRYLKVAIPFLAVLIVAMVAASWFVKSYLSEERMRALVSEMAQKSLDRKVGIGRIHVSLFRGIVVEDFEIREKDPDGVFFKTKHFVLKYRFLPLFAKRLVIDELRVEDVDVSLKVHPDGTYNFSDLAKAGGKADRKDGEQKTSGLPVSLNVRSVTIREARLHYTDAAGRLKKAEMIAHASLSLTGHSRQALSSEGVFQGTVTEATLKEGGKGLKDIRADVRYNIGLDLDGKKVSIHSVEGRILDIPFSVEGTVDYSAGAAYALTVKVPDQDLSRIRKDVLSAFLPEGTVLGGHVSMGLRAGGKDGQPGPPGWSGHVMMTRASVANQGMNLILDGSVRLTPGLLKLEGMKLFAGQNSAQIEGWVKTDRETPQVNVSVQSRSIRLDELLMAASPPAKPQETAKGDGGAPGQVSAQGPGGRKELEPIALKLNVDATVDIDQTRYKGISISHFRSRYELKNNVLNVPYLKGRTLSGAFALQGSVDLGQRGTRYHGTADLSGVRIEEMVDAFAPKARGKLFGALSGRAEVSGAGTLPENVKRNLKGKGAFAVQDGVLKNAELSAGLLAFLGLQELREIPMEKADGTFTISEGIVHLATQIGSKDMTIHETGTISMDESLDLAVLVKVSERLSLRLARSPSLSGVLTDEKGWTGVPLRVGGTLSRPSYGIDTKAVGRKVRDSLQKKIGEELFKRLPGAQGKPPGTDQEKGGGTGDFLKGLFGR